MRVCIFGSRGVTDRPLLDRAMLAAAGWGIVPTEVVSGREPSGADRLGEDWARDHGVPVVPFAADWADLDAPDAVVRSRRGVPYNARAGHDRNERMGEYADAGVALWDGVSPGTRDMLAIFRRLGKPVHVELTTGPKGGGGGLFDNT